jgi:cytochrome c556
MSSATSTSAERSFTDTTNLAILPPRIRFCGDRDPATDTFASPDVWTNFANFYQRAAEASKLAFDASRKKRGNEFKLLISQLRTACNGCHASFMKSE